MKNNGKAPFWPMLIGSGFGTGFSPFAPGTAGALLALLVWLGLSCLLSASAVFRLTAGLCLLFTAAGVWSSGILENYWGEDPSRVVVDEMVGTWIVLLAVPAGNFWMGLAGFGLFRLLDIYKPLGIRRMENFKGGWGIMLDDILAGVYGLIIMLLLQCVLG